MGGITIEKETKGPVATLISDRRLFLNSDKTAVVESNSDDAAYLLAGEGCEIDPDSVAKFGLTVEDGKIVVPGADVQGDNGVPFASKAAKAAADEAGLTLGDFSGKTPAKGGKFSLEEVKAIIAAKPQA